MTTTPAPRSALDRFLGFFTDVHPGEGATALMLALNVFLILMAYYVLKPVREALILGEGSAELKSYMSAAQVVLLAFIVPVLRAAGAEVPAHAADQHRDGVLRRAAWWSSTCSRRSSVPLAIVFFLWIGIFNLMIVAQFWSFANDVYTKDEGERLFAIVGFGASLGAVVGARDRGSADRAARRLPADAAGRRRARGAGAAHQLIDRARAGPDAAISCRGAGSRPAKGAGHARLRAWCSRRATCC